MLLRRTLKEPAAALPDSNAMAQSEPEKPFDQHAG
jgi:hypothetical protein